jgi:glycosyltransferase involved in cell wall biosynthesis
VILAVGKLKPQKDFATLVRAFAEARRQRAMRLIVLGEGEERDSLRRLAEKLGVAVDVAIPGFAENPFAYMARAAMLAQTSRWEGFSNVVAEALACGCPVVATDCPGGTREILAGGRFGRLVAVGAVPAIAAAILATLAESPPRDELRRRAESFGVTIAVERYLEVLAGCVESSNDTRRSRSSSTA